MSRPEVTELLETGSIHTSPGGQYSFRVIGPCCRLFDREELPWPCCRLAWRSKEPSWRRVGRRFVADLAAWDFMVQGLMQKSSAGAVGRK